MTSIASSSNQITILPELKIVCGWTNKPGNIEIGNGKIIQGVYTVKFTSQKERRVELAEKIAEFMRNSIAFKS